jgi:secreted trypsin-like serine protease
MTRTGLIIYLIGWFSMLQPTYCVTTTSSYDKEQEIIDIIEINVQPKEIVGGEVVETEELVSVNESSSSSYDKYPYAYYGHSASMEKLCGATLIYHDLLITAAHCINAFIDSGIYINTTKLRTSGQWYRVLREIQHPLYPKNSNIQNDDESNDIMLVQIEIIAPSTLSSSSSLHDHNITTSTTNSTKYKSDTKNTTMFDVFQSPDNKFVTLNFDANVPMDQDELTIIGFGDTLTGGSFSPHLLKVNVQTINSDLCQESYGFIPSSNNINYVNVTTMLCNGSLNYTLGGQDSCQGDSGGPLLLSSTNIQVGIVSFGKGCAIPNVSSVNTRISAYQRWITLGICIVSYYPPNTTVCQNITADDFQYFWGKNHSYDKMKSNDDIILTGDDDSIRIEFPNTSSCYLCNNSSNATILYPYNTIDIPSTFLLTSATSTVSTTTTQRRFGNSRINLSCWQLYQNARMALYSNETCQNLQTRTMYRQVCGCATALSTTNNNDNNMDDLLFDDDRSSWNDDIQVEDAIDHNETLHNDNSSAIIAWNQSTMTNNTVCYICTGDPNYQIDDRSYPNTVVYQNHPYTCYDLEQLGLNRSMDDTVCMNVILFISFASTQSNQVGCSCQSISTASTGPCLDNNNHSIPENEKNSMENNHSTIIRCNNNVTSSNKSPLSEKVTNTSSDSFSILPNSVASIGYRILFFLMLIIF